MLEQVRPGMEEILGGQSLRDANPANRTGTELETPAEFTEKGAVSNESIRAKLAELGLVFEGKRERLSGGFFGPLYVLEAKTPDGTLVKIVEKVFTSSRKAGGRRYSTQTTESMDRFPESKVRSRLKVVDAQTGEPRVAIVDWLYNEEMALRNLQGVPGVPKGYGAVYEGLKGSILEQYVDGFDLTFCDENMQTHEEIDEVMDRFRDAYMAAAERGYVFPNPSGTTVMVDGKTRQPYLMDWYAHSYGSVQADGPVRDKYESGLKQIEQRRQWTHEALAERQKSAA